MLSSHEIEGRLAALGKRCETMAILTGMVSAQLERERRELQELRAAIAASPEPQNTDQALAAEISADMLAST